MPIRTTAAIASLCAVTLWADKKVIEPGQVSNDEVEITASFLTTPEEIKQALGAPLDKGIYAVKVRVRPKGDKPLKLDRDDFVLLKSDDGQRSTPFAPTQIAGTGGLTLQSRTLGGWAAQGNGPVWGGVGGPPRQGPLGGGSMGSSTAQVEQVEAQQKVGKEKDNPLLEILRAKELPMKPTTEPVEGYLYFPVDGKVKLKNISLFYKAPSEKLELRFQR